MAESWKCANVQIQILYLQQKHFSIFVSEIDTKGLFCTCIRYIVLRVIRKEHSTKAKTVGEKLFFADPAFYPALGGDLGTSREAIVAFFLEQAGWNVEALADEQAGDFAISRTGPDTRTERYTLEVGGRSKKPKQADFVIRDDIDYPAGNAIPLWLAGFMF
ncbi:hypothetical protein SPIROBIBN47_30015 [uncultured spirochete]|jgi:hypothetical protein|uniref:DUF4143 domain-containing protein n=1 Tax=uncultured spirochete TaxID=156406 RepID=A0A3P3XJM1_9SPIR|nr:hypothetical protein [Rectinema subterraneum]SLM13892.1 hypothetical protein SPIROBIBN47_30015 [uncultured spirochete]